MQRGFVFLLACVTGLPSARAAEKKFSEAVRPGEFAAAGLGKLSAAELARLDVLVGDFKSGALETARREVTDARKARAEAESRATKAEAETRARAAADSYPKKSEPGLLAKAKVMLTPGTEVEYSTVESRIAGEFRGWEGPTVFTLENGQRWQATGTSSYVTPPIASPVVKIVPGMLGAFWMTIEGVKPRVKVTLAGAGR